MGQRIRRARRAAWRTEILLGDLDAATKGPGAYGKRVVRKKVYRAAGRGLRRYLRSCGL